jgi:hypothetical protein
MVRYLFDGGEAVIDTAGNTQANYGFTVWTDRTGGTNVTADMMAPDGVTPATVETDSDGEVPYLRGPEEARLLYRDMGTDTRTPWYSAEAVGQALIGLPSGGTSGQILTKASEADYDTEWDTPPGGGSGGATAHAELSGLANDDHPQYLTQARGDARYDTTAEVDGKISSAVAANSSGDRSRANHTGTQTQSTVTGLVTALTSRAEVVSVTTGSEARPTSSTVVIWICPAGVDPANAAGGDLIFEAD